MRKKLLVVALLLSLGDSVVKADVDWRAKGAVTAVKNQGASACNFSWAFATIGIVEGAYEIHSGVLHSLSEQELVDCASRCGGSASAGQCSCPQLGCAFTFIDTTGLCSEASYPYTGRAGPCVPCGSPTVSSGLGINWMRLGPGNENALVTALAQGPILARLEVGLHGATLPAYSTYAGGVFAPLNFDSTVVQWVLVVGYTSSYFIVKNSLGTSWGEAGYMKLARGGNFLGVDNYAYSLILGSGEAGPVPAAPCATFGIGAPVLSDGATAGLALVLGIAGLAFLLRRAAWVR